MSRATTTKLLASAKNKVGVSQRRLARKYHVSQSTVHRILKKNNIRLHKRQRAPKYTAKQLEKIPKFCRALRLKYFARDTFIVMDDEKYFTFAHHELSENDHYYTDDVESTPDNVKFAGKGKFEPKVLMWIAISMKGLLAPYIRPIVGPAVDSDVYIANCLSKLKDFIEKNHSNDDYVFWPDLTSCHFSKKTLTWLNGQNIRFVPKEDNPPNVPQARPIEKFWGVLSRLVYDGGWEAKTERQLVDRIKKKLKEVDLSVIQEHSADFKKN